MIALVAVAVLVSVSGVYAWRIVSALNQAQDAAVVPLPTRTLSIGGYQATSTPSPDTAGRPTATPGVAVAAGDASPESTPEASVTPAPDDAGNDEVDQTPLATAGDSSRLEIFEAAVASLQGGDPGRSDVWGGKSHINILVLGVDRRPDGGDQNSDVTMIARVNLIDKRVSAVSLPRDLLVDIPGVGPGKLNGAYNAGVEADPDDDAAGVVKVRDTVESAYGIPIHGYVLIDFNGFEDVIDAVGGVDVVVPEPIVDEAYPTIDYGTERVEFKQGLQHMDGERALKYVRTRNTDSDDARRDRQMQVLLALFDQGRDIGSIRKGDEIILALSDNVQTSFDFKQQLTLARVGWETDRADITLTTLEEPLIVGGETEDGLWVYQGDPAEIAGFIDEALRAGTSAGS